MTLDEEQALAAVAQDAIKELRARRRWKIIGRIVWVLLIVLFMAGIFGRYSETKLTIKEPFIAYINIDGVISASDYANAEDINKALEKAFENKQAKAVFLNINSPGGSPVQSGQVFRMIKRLKEERADLPVYAFINDTGASGAYYIAAAADKIYADPASVVGSIGVIAGGIGYGKLLEKLGIEDRTHTAGEHKAFLNPAQPEKPEEVAHLQGLLTDLHQQFIAAVKKGRGDRLQDAAHPEIFSGLFWSGEQALALGLVDSLDDMRVVVKQQFDDAPLVDFSAPRSVWEEVMMNTAMQGKASLRQLSGVGQQVQAILQK
ncbi:signal peptide peptidase SppA [Suttonella ornithocola]|uniref:Probable protease sohB n=1 Tax=Suttonella ornithocola TaxID=279832 RepID=A0A380N0R5_9GAMM|nr:signal peptide peptidase SppA [Suttonella ornithocola]SUO97713.1 Probable protease sohB [Suttonella ornithocola]